jgi:hypothetical protein
MFLRIQRAEVTDRLAEFFGSYDTPHDFAGARGRLYITLAAILNATSTNYESLARVPS